MPEWSVSYTFQDNNGRKSQARVFYNGGLSLAAVVSRAEALAAVLMDVSSARLDNIKYSRLYTVAGAPPASIASDAKARLLLFYGNDTGAATLSVPSPGPLPLDMVGAFRNVRLVLDAPSVSPLLASLGGSLASAVSPRGTAWTMPLLAGAVTRYGGS